MENTKKHRDFVDEPMGNKSVMSLPGIGMTLGRRLERKGFDKANAVLAKFLMLKKDREKFTEWLMDVCRANSSQAELCYQCLRDWCDAFV